MSVHANISLMWRADRRKNRHRRGGRCLIHSRHCRPLTILADLGVKFEMCAAYLYKNIFDHLQ